MTLSILIVNWNSRELLRECLLSIRATCPDLSPQIVVVDGGSFDGCGEMLAADFPEVEFVQSEVNIGFGRSNNLGFQRVRGEAVLLLNPDTEIAPGAVQALLGELQCLPQAGMVGPRLLNSDLSLQISVHALPKPLRQAFDNDRLRRLLWPVGMWAPPSDFAPIESTAVEAVSGACMLLRRDSFRAVGGFSPDYFMYAEDMDLCLKIQRLGLRIYHIPHARVVHHSGASSSAQGGKFSAVMTREALHIYMQRNHGWVHALAYRVASGISALFRLVCMFSGWAATTDSNRRDVFRAGIARATAIAGWSIGLHPWARRLQSTTTVEPDCSRSGAVAKAPDSAIPA